MSDKTDKEPTGAPEVPAHLRKHLDKTKPEHVPKPEPEDEKDKKNGEPDAEDTASSSKDKTDEKDEPAVKLDDEKTDEAVTDIVKTESDDLLAAQDNASASLETTQPKRKWWKSGRFWKIVVLLLFVAAAILFAVPTTRYWILNTCGVRASASVTALDNTTGQPLKNVNVTIGDQTVQTDDEGTAKVDRLKLGKNTLTLERVAFEKQSYDVTIGWGSNPLGTYRLSATGAQYTFLVTDYLSGKPIPNAEASNMQATASGDELGKVVLTLENTTAEQATATLSAPGYREEQITFSLESTEAVNVVLVPSTKAVFVSREGGKYDVYTIDIDGKNKKLLLSGTGRESGNIALVPSPDGTQAALVSTRDDVRAADGKLLSTLTLINVENGSTVATDRGEQVQIIDWIGSRVIYSMVVSGQDAGSNSRHRIISYDYRNNSRAQLASANQIRSAASALGYVYFTDGTAFYRINPDGSARQTLLDKPVWSAYRTDYDTLTIQAEGGWYRVSLNNGSLAPIAEPASYQNRVYVADSAGRQTAWAENGNLHLLTLDSAKDSVLHSQGGLTYPLRWLTDTALIYRVSSGQEIADYAISSQGGQARKITNVTATFGINPAF